MICGNGFSQEQNPFDGRRLSLRAMNAMIVSMTMRRREFTTGLLASTAAPGLWQVAAHAQKGALPSVGFLRMTSAADSAHLAAGFRQGLKEAGFIEGQNVSIEYRYADNQRE